MANVPIKRLEDFVMKLLDIENIRDIRLATKGLMGIPQHFLQDDVRAAARADGDEGARARSRHRAAHARELRAAGDARSSATPRAMFLDAGFRDVRNQGVLLRGVNTAPNELLELCFMLLDHAKIMPYYFYMCDMIPNSEHWRTSVAEAQDLQYALLGYMPGFATPRVVCDVPFVGKRWVHMLKDYDRREGHLVLDEELPDGHRVRRPGRARPASIRTTTRSTRCPRRGRSGGAGRCGRTTVSSRRRSRDAAALAQDSTTTVNSSLYCWNSSSESALYSWRFAEARSSGGNSSGLVDSVS